MNEQLPESGTDCSKPEVCPEEKKKGEFLVICSVCINMLLTFSPLIDFNNYVACIVGGFILMINGTLSHFGLKLLKNDVLRNLPVWEAVCGGIIVIMGTFFMIST